MPFITITRDTIKQLCAIDPADTGQDTAVDNALALRLAALNYTLDPAALTAAQTDTGLSALLELGLAETIAGDYLAQTARASGATDDFRLSELSVTASRTQNPALLGEKLSLQGLARLRPFGRAPQSLATVYAPDAQTDGPLLLGPAPALSVFDDPWDEGGLPC